MNVWEQIESIPNYERIFLQDGALRPFDERAGKRAALEAGRLTPGLFEPFILFRRNNLMCDGEGE